MKYKRDEINELLVDYLENDVSEGLKNDLDLVVRNSSVRGKTLKALGETRKLVKAAEPIMPNLSDDFFNKLHDKVMAQVAEQKPRTRVLLWLEDQSWQTYAAAIAFVLLTGSVLFSVLKPTVTFQTAGLENPHGDMLLSISVEVPEVFADSLLNDRNSSDFYMDAMAEKVAQLEEHNANNLIDSIGDR